MRVSERKLGRATAALGLAIVLAMTGGCGSSDPAAGGVSAALSVTVSGSVHDGTGAPVADAQLEFVQDGIPQGWVTTAPDGTWSLAIEDGVYDIVITPPPGSTFASQTLVAQEIAEGTTFQVVLVSAELVTYTAQLRDRDGAGLAGATVCLIADRGNTCGTTDAAGDATLEIQPGNYGVGVQVSDVTSSSPLPANAMLILPQRSVSGDATETITIENRALTGVLVDSDGSPVADVAVMASGNVTIGDEMRWFDDRAQTDASGRFALGVLQGPVEIYVAPEPDSGLAITTLSTTVDGDADIVVTVPRVVRWTALFRDRDGNALPDLMVCLTSSASFCGTTDAAGDVQIAAAPGSYGLQVDLMGSVDPRLPQMGTLTLPGPTLSADVTETITIENRTLSGVVVDADGNPVPNVGVNAAGTLTVPGGSGDFHDTTTTDASGRFALRMLQGTVDLDVLPDPESGYAMTSLSTVVDGDTELVITLPRPVVWTGHIRDRDGVALVGVMVCLEASWGKCDVTDAAGDVRLAVAPGSYGLSIQTVDPSAHPQLPDDLIRRLPGPTLSADLTETVTLDNRVLSGVVVDADGNPVPNASLSASGNTSIPAGWSWYADSAQTDASGRFRLGALDGTSEIYVTPDPATGLEPFVLQGVVVDGDTSVAIAVQFLTDAVEAPIAAGETASTDHEGDGATPADPVETTLTSPVTGNVSIQEAPITESAPSGYSFLTQQVNVVAPLASADAPLVITFTIDGSRIPLGQDETTLQIFRNGVVVPACTGPEGVAAPDPCVTRRERAGDDVVITVLSSAASTWHLGERRIGDADQDGLLDDVDACPAEAEDFDGFLDEDGCPDLDDDSDGVPDAIDLCPREPEDLDGFEDDDGCSETGPDTGPSCPDLDGDGRVTVRDMVVVARSLGSSLDDCRYREEADLDRDGDVDVSDLRIVRRQRGTVCPAP